MKLFTFSSRSYRFFSRMLLICTILLAVFSFGVSILISSLSYRYEKSQFLKPYDLAAVNLSETFESHLSNFYLLAGKLLSNQQCNPDLCSLLTADSYEKVSGTTRNACIRLFSELCSDNRYLLGFLMYAPEKGQLYYYSDSYSYLGHADFVLDFPALVPYACVPIPIAEVSQMISACDPEASAASSCYGLSATIFKNPSRPLGYLIPLYSLTEYSNVLSHFDLSGNDTFQIRDNLGNLLFCSNPLLDITDASFSHTVTANDRYSFTVEYYVRNYQFPRASVTYLTLLSAILLTLFSFGLYYLTYYLSNKNINGILDGMKRFQLQDLTYRIPSQPGHNEFTQIIDGFNDMCGKLQENVEKSYVYELQQKKSELYALQTSINPHFLYNTLEMIRSQILNSRSSDASQMLLLLSKIYRSQTNGSLFVPLDRELELCENLMILYQYRFQNFEYEFDLDETLNGFALPKNSLQPLLENFFVHGVDAERQDHLLLLSTSAEKKGDQTWIHLTIANNGNPISKEREELLNEKLRQNGYVEKNAVGFALTNVASRLRIVFQNDCQIFIRSDEDMTFQIHLIFPAKTVEQLSSSFSE